MLSSRHCSVRGEEEFAETVTPLRRQNFGV